MKNLSTPALVRLGAVVVTVAALAGGLGGWVTLDVVEATAAVAPDLRQIGDPSSDLITSVDATLEEVQGSLTTLADVVGRVGTSSGDAAAVMAEVAALSTDRIPATLAALQEALPALVDTAAVIDETMRTLSVLGVDYRPQVPLDDALRDVETQLEGLPESIRGQGEKLEALADEIRTTGADAELLTGRIDAIAQNLDDARATLDDYQTALGDLDRLSDLGDRVTSLMPVARIALVVMALTGVALGTTGWQMSNRLSG